MSISGIDATPLRGASPTTHLRTHIRDLVRASDEEAAQALLPVELPYTLPAEASALIGGWTGAEH